MKILVLTPLTPLRQEGGLQNRVWHFWRRVARHHNITMMCFDSHRSRFGTEKKESLRIMAFPLQKNWRRFIYAFLTGNSPTFYLFNPKIFVRACEKEFRREPYDVVVADHLWCAPTAKRFRSRVPIIFFSHGFEAVIWDRMIEKASFLLSPIYKVLSRNLRDTELKFFRDFDFASCVSERERKYVLEQTGAEAKRIFVVPNGVQLNLGAVSKPVVKGVVPLLFLGSMNYLPNDEGIRYFIKEVFLKLRQRYPHLKLKIVGPNPAPWLQDVGKKDSLIEVTGFVDDLSSVFKFESICVVPIWVGSGSRVKILEYWSHCLPVVSTTVGAEGLKYKHQKNILIADHSEGLVEAIATLIEHPEQRLALGAAGKKTVDELYDWDKITEDFEEFLRSRLEGRASSR